MAYEIQRKLWAAAKPARNIYRNSLLFAIHCYKTIRLLQNTAHRFLQAGGAVIAESSYDRTGGAVL